MATLSLTISGRVYDIACDDSQVAHIQGLGRDLDERAQAILAQVGNVPDARLMLMVALTIADELGNAKAELAKTGGDLGQLAADDERLAGVIESLASRIETIADRLERA